MGVEQGDEPVDAEVLHPRRALHERTEVEAIEARGGRRLDRELEPRDLSRSDVRRRLDRDAVVARPSGRGRSVRAVATERRCSVLTRLRFPRADVRDLAETAAHPPETAAVVVIARPDRTITG